MRANLTKNVVKVMKKVATIVVTLPGSDEWTTVNITNVTSNRAAAICPACTRANAPACSCVPEVGGCYSRRLRVVRCRWVVAGVPGDCIHDHMCLSMWLERLACTWPHEPMMIIWRPPNT